jgi:GTPase SAR1 family protein
MDDIQKNIVTLLQKSAERLREAKLPEELAAQLEQCATQVYQPCVVAVVGQVKAGKSTFINAFLSEDLAKVGTTETTATINYFLYGKITSDKPVHCFWRGGRDDYIDLDFVNSLQGNDIETLRRADGIDRLEYYLLNHYLEQVTLVDTPGMSAVVEEHQKRTAEFIHLERQLRERHNTETQQLGSKADAVIYLISSTARETDRAFLEEFQQVTQDQQSRAFNAIGVMAKIDLYRDVMNRRVELAAKIAGQLKESLNTVVPVSAGLRRALDCLLENNGAGLRRLMEAMRRIPPAKLEKFLDNEEFFLELDPSDYPIPIEEPAALLGDMPWTVFTTIARVAADLALDMDAITQRINDLAGFDQLREVLERHFFKRSQILRCHRILKDADQVLKTIKYKRLPEFREGDRKEKARQDRFLTFLRQVEHVNPNVVQDLKKYIEDEGHVTERAKRVEQLLEQLEREFGGISFQLNQYSMDFDALHQVLNHKDSFSPAELDELQAVLGLYGMDLEKRLPPGQVSFEYVREHQIYWRGISIDDANPLRRDVAQQVASRYGFILEEMSKRTAI